MSDTAKAARLAKLVAQFDLFRIWAKRSEVSKPEIEAYAAGFDSRQWMPMHDPDIQQIKTQKTRIDIYAKTWIPHKDEFHYRRFTDCYWRDGDRLSNTTPQWINVPSEYFPTHWQYITEPEIKA